MDAIKKLEHTDWFKGIFKTSLASADERALIVKTIKNPGRIPNYQMNLHTFLGRFKRDWVPQQYEDLVLQGADTMYFAFEHFWNLGVYPNPIEDSPKE